ncbi:MAG: KTSC domain-containing protein [Isosphaeraceae bacterium]|nr:KTSC domain-containing protein [Isosphaeraceae bacterium]
MHRRPVDSTLIRSVGYDLASSVLEIEFITEDRIYEYFDVPLSIYSELMAAESKGLYFNEYIKDMYSYQQVD